MPDLDYTVIVKEPLSSSCRAITPGVAGHHRASRYAGEIFIGMSSTAPTLQVVIDDYLKRSGMDSGQCTGSTIWRWRVAIASTRGVALLRKRRTSAGSVTSRPLDGEAPTIVSSSYNKTNARQFSDYSFRRVDQRKKKRAPQTHDCGR